MSQKIKLGKRGFVRGSYKNTIDTTFSQLIPPTPPIQEVATVEEFFELYQTLFYEIPSEGSINSHPFIIQRSTEYIGATEEKEQDIQILLEEITKLREELLQTQKELRDTQLEAVSEKNKNTTTGVEDELPQTTSGILPGTQLTSQETLI
jgi:hypothetical protein|tara:strand:+ start:1078 stop:1527 length:450 start_codon:yes stop_codon:yes gene_type:complete